VTSFNDHRIRLLSNTRRVGIGYCHNRVFENSDSDIIAHIDSDDMILRGSLKKMYDTLII